MHMIFSSNAAVRQHAASQRDWAATRAASPVPRTQVVKGEVVAVEDFAKRATRLSGVGQDTVVVLLDACDPRGNRSALCEIGACDPRLPSGLKRRMFPCTVALPLQSRTQRHILRCGCVNRYTKKQEVSPGHGCCREGKDAPQAAKVLADAVAKVCQPLQTQHSCRMRASINSPPY